MEAFEKNRSSDRLSFKEKLHLSATETFIPSGSRRVKEINQEEFFTRSQRALLKNSQSRFLEPEDRPDYSLPFNKMDELSSKALDFLRFTMIVVMILNEETRMQIMAGYALTGLAHSVYLNYYQDRFHNKRNAP